MYGCLKETPSARDYRYEEVCGSVESNLPKSYILPDDCLPEVRDQGNVGACVAFACVEIAEVLNRKEFGTNTTLSAGFFYGFNREDNADHEGMYPSKTLDRFRETGSVPTTYFDELKEMPEMMKIAKARTDLIDIAKKYRIKSYLTITSPKYNVQKVNKALYETQCPLLAISNSYFGGSHAIIIIGWEEDGFVIQNSWGKNWAGDGRAKVPFDAINYVYVLTDEVFELKFTDVPEAHWAYKAIKEAVFTGMMKGTSETTFEPDRSPTRAELAQFCVNLLKKIDEIHKGGA